MQSGLRNPSQGTMICGERVDAPDCSSSKGCESKSAQSASQEKRREAREVRAVRPYRAAAGRTTLGSSLQDWASQPYWEVRWLVVQSKVFPDTTRHWEKNLSHWRKTAWESDLQAHRGQTPTPQWIKPRMIEPLRHWDVFKTRWGKKFHLGQPMFKKKPEAAELPEALVVQYRKSSRTVQTQWTQGSLVRQECNFGNTGSTFSSVFLVKMPRTEGTVRWAAENYLIPQEFAQIQVTLTFL